LQGEKGKGLGAGNLRENLGRHAVRGAGNGTGDGADQIRNTTLFNSMWE
jgi:hypothetical protein